MRGEYPRFAFYLQANAELPPRARRIHPGSGVAGLGHGTTSACAENTRVDQRWGLKIWNYLRVRGEYGNPSWDCSGIWELPPRARRIPSKTCKTAGHNGNYLRVRGEYYDSSSSCSRCMELPPRARRIPMGVMLADPAGGTTSACAENTCIGCSIRRRIGNYLRVRGEYLLPEPEQNQ